MALPPTKQPHIAWLSADGEVVNLTYLASSWPGSRGRSGVAHSGEGLLLYPGGCEDGGDAVIARDWGWPKAVGMSGEACFDIPFPGGQRTTAGDPVGPDGYGVRVADFDHDGRAELLIHDRTTAWLFAPSFPDDGASARQAKLEPVTGQGWYAF